MPKVYEYEDGKPTREGYIGEVHCPICGNPVPATFYSDGTVKTGECWTCKEEKKRKEIIN